jgi:hypothetical protein
MYSTGNKTDFNFIIINYQALNLTCLDQKKIERFVHKINDLTKRSKLKTEDKIERCKLASTYRLVDYKGWGWNIYNHITVIIHHLTF